MSGKGKGQNPSVPLRRSARERKKHSFGSDFEQEDPVLGSVPKTPRKATPEKAPDKQPEPTPGAEPDPVPPVPDPDPIPKGKFTWPSDVKHWKKDMLPKNHSKRSQFIRKRLQDIQ